MKKEYYCDECGDHVEVKDMIMGQQTPMFFSGKKSVCFKCMRKNHNLVAKSKKQDVKR